MAFVAEPNDAVGAVGDSGDERVRSASERDREILRSKRHTRFVKIARFVLPVTTVCAAALYGLSAFNASDWNDVLPALAIPTILPDKLTMDNPTYTGYNDDGGSYNVTAKTAAQDFKRPGTILLDGISGVLTDAKDAKTVLEAVSGVFDTRENRLQLNGGVDIRGADGMRAKLQSATIETKKGVISTQDPVFIGMRSSTLRANRMTLWQKRKEVLFNGDVQARLKQEGPDADLSGKPRRAVAKKPGATDSGLFSGKKTPVDVTSNSLKIVSADNIAVFSGDVRARQDEAGLATRELEVHFEAAPASKKPAADDKAKKKAAASSPFGSGSQKIDRIVAKHPVLITRGSDQQVTSQSAEFFVAQQRAVLTGQVAISSGPDRRARADRAQLNQASETVVLEGNVVVAQAQNSLRGRRLFIDRKRGLLKLTSPPGNGSGPGRVFATMHRGANPGAKPAKTTKAKGDSAAGITAFKTDPSAPIKVEANSLDVNNNAHRAVFHGGVVAKQGAFRIESASLSILYTGKIDVADPSAKGAGSSSKKQDGGPELKKVIAKKNVTVTSREGQRATGDWAEFDVVGNTIEIGGAVTLRQGKNVVRGTLLKIDMDSGRSVIETSSEDLATGTAWVKDADGQAASGNAKKPPAGFSSNGKRPSAVFYPFQLKKDQKGKKGKTGSKRAPAGGGKTSGAAVSGASSWSATAQ